MSQATCGCGSCGVGFGCDSFGLGRDCGRDVGRLERMESEGEHLGSAGQTIKNLSQT